MDDIVLPPYRGNPQVPVVVIPPGWVFASSRARTYVQRHGACGSGMHRLAAAGLLLTMVPDSQGGRAAELERVFAGHAPTLTHSLRTWAAAISADDQDHLDAMAEQFAFAVADAVLEGRACAADDFTTLRGLLLALGTLGRGQRAYAYAAGVLPC